MAIHLSQKTKLAAATFVLMSASVFSQISESFESGLPTAYGNTTSYNLSSGVWTGEANAVIRGNMGVKSGQYSLQLRSQTNANVVSPTITSGVSTVTFYASASTTSNGLQVNYSTDNGATWIPATGSPFTNLTIGNTTLQYTATINSASPNIKIQFRRTAATIYIDDIVINPYSTAITWNGTAWSNGSGPTANDDAVIAGNYSGAAFSAKNITVNSGSTLTVNSSLSVQNITNNGAIVIADGGNLLQGANATYSGTGTFKLQRNTQTAAGKYAMWSSPVAGGNLYGIYGASQPQYVTAYDTPNDQYTILANPANPVSGQGYAVLAPAGPAAVEFNGTPNNGTVSLPLAMGGVGNYNLIGNPYPSALDMEAFYYTNTSNVNSTAWFWDNNTTAQGSTTDNQGYATFNMNTSTWVAAPNTGTTPSGTVIAPGQAFLVEAAKAGNVTFDNTQRVAQSGLNFNKKNAGDKIWLRLSNASNNIKYSQAITFLPNGTVGVDATDSKQLNNGGQYNFYSLIGSEKMVINGMPSFMPSHKINLGATLGAAGSYNISLTDKEGRFSTGTPVYLLDKVSGNVVDLQTQDYTFTENAGEITGRFEIVFDNKMLSVAGTDAVREQIRIAKDGDHFVVSSAENIESVSVFTAAGEQVISAKPSATTYRFAIPASGVYFVNVKNATTTKSTKIIK